jgi:RNA polymerase sigma-70 factor (ECF subfamily)
LCAFGLVIGAVFSGASGELADDNWQSTQVVGNTHRRAESEKSCDALRPTGNLAMVVDGSSGRVMDSPNLLRYLWRTAANPSGGWADGRLLDQFAAGGSSGEAAFELIVRRHGPMVLRVCRGALGEALADDAFQATFLILLRRAGAARRAGCLDAWLFGVARRVCAAARRAAGRRVLYEGRAAILPDAPARVGPTLEPDVAAAVHAEVGRLPAGERAAVVLCDLAGLTYSEAADRLGQSVAAIRGRLARARDRLRRRMRGRGFGPAAVWVVPVALPAGLVAATGQAAMVMAGRAAGAVPASVSALFAGGLESMLWTKCKATGLAALTAGVLMAGAVGLNARQTFDKAPSTAAQADPLRATLNDPTRPAEARDPRTTPAADRQDVGDELATLVRRAQRQQDRGDVRAAMATLDEIDAAARKWRAQLADQVRQAQAINRLRMGDDDADRRAKAGAALTYDLNKAGRGSDVEGRLAAVEAKLDELLRALDGDRGQNRRGRERTAPATVPSDPRGRMPSP